VNLVVLPLPGSERQGEALCSALEGERGAVELRSFPDGESYVRIVSNVSERDVAIVCTLDRPDPKLLPLCFLAHAAREQGARRVGLVAPYLAYMRQDKQFKVGEAVTSVPFARLLSGFVDWLVTVDPHLHRRSGLEEIYTVPSRVLHAAPAISRWIEAKVEKPLLVGPDEESQQWVEAIAEGAHAPHVVLRKVRRGDRDVEVSVPQVERWKGHTPVLADDIISTGRTMIETLRHLHAAGMSAPICVGVHAVFAGGSYDELKAAGVQRVVTCDAIAHPSNEIPLGDLLANGVREVLNDLDERSALARKG
jgi:ribose-phosphate pyrophosphokinase